MKHLKPLLLFLLVLILEITYSKSACAALTLDFETSSRVNQLNWNIANDITGQTTPNILSELSWTNITTQVFDLHAKANFNDRFSLTGLISYGLIYQGANQDSDYMGNNRTGEFSRSNNNSSDGATFDASLALSCRIIRTKSWFMSGSLGFSSYNQYLVMTDGYQTISVPPNQTTPLGSFPGLDSAYNASWNGPWIGLNGDCYISKRFSLTGNFEYHLANYSGDGDWNLRSDLAHPVSFSHAATGNGTILSIGINYKYNDRWLAGLSLESSSWSTNPGFDITWFADGSYGITRLNQVNWSFFAVTLKLIHPLSLE